ncbi:glycoside hydrolase family 61 protein [Phlyctema vagabunda]|uniref:AA9 family lytic polysaccharide monooxygenase n=1 Tax=Phlyctema vagabunda TaxID=108571 RepID=A0ABR4PRA0_9HELO
MKSFLICSGLLATATSVLGHATFQELWVNGVDQVGTCVRTPPSNNPVSSVTSTDIRCNVGGTTGVAGLCTVPAGSTVTVEMHQQPGDRSCANEAIGGAHYGPVIVYMSKVADAKTDAGAGSWFKVSQEGYDTTKKYWGSVRLVLQLKLPTIIIQPPLTCSLSL